MHSVFAVILNWNNPEDTSACVTSLRETSPGLAEIVVVDNGSAPAKLETLTGSINGATLLRNVENLGYAGGLQTGVDYCLEQEADLIWLLNNDTSFANSTLSELLACVKRNGMHYIYAPKLLDPNNHQRVIFNGRFFNHSTASFGNARKGDTYCYGKSDQDLITEAVSGASFLVPADVIRKHGFMSHDYFLYFEEFDYALRMRSLGIECICAQASEMFHSREGAKGLNPEKLDRVRTYYRTRNKIIFFRRRFEKALALRCICKHVLQTLKGLRTKGDWRTQLLAIWHGLIGTSGKVLIP